MRVRFTKKAKNRLQEIYLYYLNLLQGKAGRKIRANIIIKTLRLREFPLLGPEDEFSKKFGLNHRYLIEGSYKIIYRIADNEVLIIDIFDTRQDPDKMLPR